MADFYDTDAAAALGCPVSAGHRWAPMPEKETDMKATTRQMRPDEMHRTPVEREVDAMLAEIEQKQRDAKAFYRVLRFTDAYDLPVPSQFQDAPRARNRCPDDFSTAGYQRALTADALAMAGNLDAFGYGV